MPIEALRPATTRLIGSAQVLTDPSSVVKELIDNALDARATSISVEIATNTIDVIQVRDNGHGIAPDDRAMVCRRYCTSKIRSFDDLRRVGGSVLGFRGEALASLAEMSGSLSVMTRVEGEACAVNLKIGRAGEVEGTEKASHPVGTTIRATDFFKGIPVRRQAALKHSVRYLAKIKRTMQAYALCRPAVRLSLKVLKAKNDKGNWVYAPKQGAGVEDAALKVVGRDCAAQCSWLVLESYGFTMQAFLPKQDVDSAKISGIGQFLSVDSRPVSATRQTLKKVVSIFKEKLRKANSKPDSVKDPFLYLNVVCPPDSYDPNVEPAKDDVLFDNEANVLAAAEELFLACYPQVPLETAQSSPGVQPREASTPTESQPVIEVFEDESNVTHTSAGGRRAWRSNMYGHDEEDTVVADDRPHSVQEDDGDAEQNARSVEVSNPWIIAKMTTSAPKKRPTSLNNGQLMTPLRERSGAEINSSSPVRAASHMQSRIQTPFTPQPSPSAANIGPGSSQGESLHQIIQRPASPQPHHGVSDDEVSLLSARQSSIQSRNDFVTARELTLGTALHAIPEAASRPHRPAPSKQPKDVNRPLKSSLNDASDVWFKISSSSQPLRQRGPPGKRGRPVGAQPFWTPRSQAYDAADALIDRITSSDTRNNRDIRDFVTAGELVAAGPRWSDEHSTVAGTEDADMLLQPPSPHARERGSSSVTSAASPVSRRLRRVPGSPEAMVDEIDAEFQRHLVGARVRPRPALAEDLQHTVSTSIESGAQARDEQHTDAPQRKRRRTADGGLQRSKSANLPLERVPAKFRVQDLTLKAPAFTNSISEGLQRLDTATNRVDWHLPPDTAFNAFAIPPTPSELQAWTVRLTASLNGLFPNQEVEGSLGQVLSAAVSQHMNDYLAVDSA